MKSPSFFRSFGALGALVLASLLIASAAQAQNDAALAEALFNQGRTAFDEGDYGEACAKFSESYRIEATLGTQLNLAACEAKRNHVATAWGLFRAVEQKLTVKDPRRAYVQKNIEELEPRVPHVVLRLKKGSPVETTIRVGVVQVGAAGFGQGLPVDPGHHRWVVSAPQRENSLLELTIQEGETLEVEVEAGVPEVSNEGMHDVSSSGTSSIDTDAPPSSNLTHRIGAFTGVGVGALGVAGTAVFGAMTLSQKKKGDEACPSADSCTKDGSQALDRARRYRLLSNISLGAAVLGAGVATYFFFQLRGGEDEDTTATPSLEQTERERRLTRGWATVHLGLMPVPSGAEVQLVGSFF